MERSANPAARDHRNVTKEQKRQLGVRFLDYRGAEKDQGDLVIGSSVDRTYRECSMDGSRFGGIQHFLGLSDAGFSDDRRPRADDGFC